MIDEHVLVVELNVVETVISEPDRKVVFLRTIKNARRVRPKEICDFFEENSITRFHGASGLRALEGMLAPRPGLMRIVVIDDTEPILRSPLWCPLAVEITDEHISQLYNIVSSEEKDGDWFSTLAARVCRTDNAWKNPIRTEAVRDWWSKNESDCVLASVHALGVKAHPERSGELHHSLYAR